MFVLVGISKAIYVYCTQKRLQNYKKKSTYASFNPKFWMCKIHTSHFHISSVGADSCHNINIIYILYYYIMTILWGVHSICESVKMWNACIIVPLRLRKMFFRSFLIKTKKCIFLNFFCKKICKTQFLHRIFAPSNKNNEYGTNKFYQTLRHRSDPRQTRITHLLHS